MAGGGGGSENGEPEFQIAPMIDVLLVLLVFFMSITTAEILKVDAKIKLPVSPNAKKAEPGTFKLQVPVNVRWDDGTKKATIVLDDKEYPASEEVIAYLKKKKEANPLIRVTVRGDEKLPAIEIQRAMNLVGESGIADISFSALNKE